MAMSIGKTSRLRGNRRHPSMTANERITVGIDNYEKAKKFKYLGS